MEGANQVNVIVQRGVSIIDIHPEFDGNIELDYSTGDLDMDVKHGYNNTYTCSIKEQQIPPQDTEISTNVVTIECGE